MSIPPVPNHPPRPGRRKPAEESPDSITTQLFIGQDKPAQADGSTQALSAEEIERLRSMVSADGAEATEVLSLDELRALAAAEGPELPEDGEESTPRKASSSEIAAAEAAAAPRQWNPQGTPHSGGSEGPGRANEGFGAAGPDASRAGRASQDQGGLPHPPGGQAYGGTPVPASGVGYGRPPAPAGAGGPGGPMGAAGAAPGGPQGPSGTGPGGAGPMGAGPYRREPETTKVPAWLWVLAVIALVLALGIVGYIVWDSMQSEEDVTSAPVETRSEPAAEPTTEAPETSEPPAAVEAFASPSGNIECTIDDERARCVIASFDYTPPERPDDCQMENWGSVVVANDEDAGFSCREAPANSGPARVLGYGESVSASGMTCTSAEDGMTCTSDTSGQGFTLRRASVDFLGD